MKEKLASFLVPVLTAVVLLYQVLASLQIAVMHGATLTVIGLTLAAAAVAGLLAAFGPAAVRVGVLAACTLLFLDVTFHLSGFFSRLQPESRGRATRDEKRVADIHRIKSALEQYLVRVGPLPAPAEYGEGTGPADFWRDWWDISSADENQDGVPFLDFLVRGGILPAVPVDPVNKSTAGEDPRGGKQYVYFLVPPDYEYAGGTCDARPNRWHYMIAVTELEEQAARIPEPAGGSGCACLWRDQPNFFQKQFDYVLCGSFEATPESRTPEFRARRAAAAKQAAEGAKHVANDQRRILDVLQIQRGLEMYITEFGPLPTPQEMGEAEVTTNKSFWHRYWDVSSHDGDGDGNLFLDFLVESRIMPAVPVDPDNQRAADGGPAGGRQYVYFVAPPGEQYGGGTCGGPGQGVYMLGITDLRSELTRPPTKIWGSGCECLWRDQPNFFQQHFDYLVCGTYDATAEAKARALARRAKKEAELEARKEAEALAAVMAVNRKRIDDLLLIKKALQTYIGKVGSLPAPRDYGEAEQSTERWFFYKYWDVSGEDGDGDGKLFLDFLVDGGVLPSVPVHPENVRADDGDPRGGKQYVYFLAPPGEKFLGGSCAARKGEWVYLLGITDLRFAAGRPPEKISGSGCECLWREQPDFFQAHFDYVTCGTFRPKTAAPVKAPK